ncbi:MAG: Rossmann-like fold-containing protein, partial [Nanoarchaeota archaeon]
IQAETALKYTKDVLAVDVDKDVVEFLKKKGINSKVSDLFSNVKGKFDLIIFNPPYLPNDELEDKESKKITTGGEYGFEILERFFSQVNKYLNKNGKILIVFSSLTNKNKVNKIIKQNKLKFRLLEDKKIFFETLYFYLIERN